MTAQENSTLKKKQFTVKDVIYIIGILLSCTATYFTTINSMEKRIQTLEEKTKDINIADYVKMAEQLKTIQKTVTDLQADVKTGNEKTNKIYLILAAKFGYIN